tara:strand:- start:155 stop:631 length:477 start_codon:yes stop_codon:yes gene_type:complete
MSMKHILTIGLVPKDCQEERIECGDPGSFGGLEFTLFICSESGDISCLESEAALEAVIDDPRSIDLETWSEVCSRILEPLQGFVGLFPGHAPNQVLETAWTHFIHGTGDQANYIEPLDSEFGEFGNPRGAFNGATYLRYQVEEDDEYTRDEIVIVTPA